ncbi:hypothetical protein BpHYR1_044046 [Brachionus plicatilis]|uniref:Uncharacterized protein n=1 Tax=Brachionus plicatilis TaxID=10195 RepID=A0A3M7SEH6_BRAPC|nr:hypothetical protein BpHYR1_044046 [Brachionus plicatilis]
MSFSFLNKVRNNRKLACVFLTNGTDNYLRQTDEFIDCFNNLNIEHGFVTLSQKNKPLLSFKDLTVTKKFGWRCTYPNCSSTCETNGCIVGSSCDRPQKTMICQIKNINYKQILASEKIVLARTGVRHTRKPEVRFLVNQQASAHASRD